MMGSEEREGEGAGWGKEGSGELLGEAEASPRLEVHVLHSVNVSC